MQTKQRLADAIDVQPSCRNRILVRAYVPGTTHLLLSSPQKLPCPSWNLPPERTCLHKCTYCYAKHGRFIFDDVAGAMEARYQWVEEASDDEIVRVLGGTIRPFKYFRVMGAGDFKNARYVKHWIQICEDIPDTNFWVSTKAWTDKTILRELRKLAKLPNVTVRPSSLQPHEPAPVVKGLHAGVCIAYRHALQCPAEDNCDGCTICWHAKDKPVSYKFRGKRAKRSYRWGFTLPGKEESCLTTDAPLTVEEARSKLRIMLDLHRLPSGTKLWVEKSETYA